MDNFKKFIVERKQDKPITIVKKKKLLKHTVKISLVEGDDVKGTKSSIQIHSLIDTNVTGYVKFPTWDKALATFNSLTNVDSVVEYLQRNSQRYPTASDWAYIVRDEVDYREDSKTTLPDQPNFVDDTELDDAEFDKDSTANDGGTDLTPQQIVRKHTPKKIKTQATKFTGSNWSKAQKIMDKKGAQDGEETTSTTSVSQGSESGLDTDEEGEKELTPLEIIKQHKPNAIARAAHKRPNSNWSKANAILQRRRAKKK